jgi:hypothetical protein
VIAGYVIQAALYPWHEDSVCQITPPPTCRRGWQVGLYPVRCRIVIWIWTLPVRCWNHPTSRAQPALLMSLQVYEQRSDEAISLLRHERDCFPFATAQGFGFCARNDEMLTLRASGQAFDRAFDRALGAGSSALLRAGPAHSEEATICALLSLRLPWVPIALVPQLLTPLAMGKASFCSTLLRAATMAKGRLVVPFTCCGCWARQS